MQTNYPPSLLFNDEVRQSQMNMFLKEHVYDPETKEVYS
jgi:hypothetical protein